MIRTPDTDADHTAYVECSECGHPLERHTIYGCEALVEPCGCTASWSIKRISEQRRAAGLPVSFERWKF